MNEPQPTHEIVFEIDDRDIYIHCATSLIAQWIEQNAPKFGMFAHAGNRKFHLEVSPLFDFNEVIEYLTQGRHAKLPD